MSSNDISETSGNDTSAKAGTKPAKRRKLGKGLGALMGESRREEPLARPATPLAGNRQSPAQGGIAARARSNTPVDGGLANLAIASIEPHPEQPRSHFDEDALEELAASIASRGVIQPIIVRPLSAGRYQLVAGERRWRAAQKAQLHEIPALIRELDEREVMALALIENIQREDLNPVEEARAYQRLNRDEDMTQAEIARVVEKSRSHVANLLRLLGLPAAVLDHLESGRLDMGHARALIGRDNAEELAQQAVDKRMSVREVEKLVRANIAEGQADAGSSRKRTAREPRDPERDADIAAVENHLEEFLGLPVKIATDTDPRSGAVTIKYRTLDQLDLICQRLTGGGI